MNFHKSVAQSNNCQPFAGLISSLLPQLLLKKFGEGTFFFKLIDYVWRRWLFIGARASLWLRCAASLCSGFSLGARTLGQLGSVVGGMWLRSCGSQALEHRRNSCSTWAKLPQGMGSSQTRDRARVSCIDKRILSTEPPGKPRGTIFKANPSHVILCVNNSCLYF